MHHETHGAGAPVLLISGLGGRRGVDSSRCATSRRAITSAPSRIARWADRSPFWPGWRH